MRFQRIIFLLVVLGVVGCGTNQDLGGNYDGRLAIQSEDGTACIRSTTIRS